MKSDRANMYVSMSASAQDAALREAAQVSKSLPLLPCLWASLIATLLKAQRPLCVGTHRSQDKCHQSDFHTHLSPQTSVKDTGDCHLHKPKDHGLPRCWISLQHQRDAHPPSSTKVLSHGSQETLLPDFFWSPWFLLLHLCCLLHFLSSISDYWTLLCLYLEFLVW